MFFIICILGIFIEDKSIVLFNYTSNYKPTNLLINNVPYRETSIPKNFNGITAFEFNKGYYDFKLKNNEPNLKWKLFTNCQRIMSSQHKLNDIVINNTTLVSQKYYSDKAHLLHLAYQLILPKQNDNIEFIIDIDGQITKKITNNGISIYKFINLDAGIHYITIYSKSNNNWCSCPSMNTGFSSGRYFYSWIEPMESHLQLFKKNIKKIFSINLLSIHIIHLMIY